MRCEGPRPGSRGHVHGRPYLAPHLLLARQAPLQEGFAMTNTPDTQRGLYGKYLVSRKGDHDGKHVDCPFFVLDPKHDLFARVALQAYIVACADKYPHLAADLRQL